MIHKAFPSSNTVTSSTQALKYVIHWPTLQNKDLWHFLQSPPPLPQLAFCKFSFFPSSYLFSVCYWLTHPPILLFSGNLSPRSFPIHCFDPSWPLTLVISFQPLNIGLFSQVPASGFLFSVYTFSLEGLPALTILFNSDASNSSSTLTSWAHSGAAFLDVC